jgi:signal transduction histidine kinase
MIDQLLAFSRLDVPDALGSNEAGGARLERTAFDLAEVAAQVVGSVRAGNGAARDLRLEAPSGGDGLPPVWGDPGRIAQVLENLVTNAVKFTPAGGEIRVRLSRCGEEAEVAVADRGIGIPAAARARIFERFYQVDTSSTRAYGGMGLGLAIVREILAAHGREIRVESEEGKGTTFRFTLPLAGADAGAVPAAETVEAAMIAGPREGAA